MIYAVFLCIYGSCTVAVPQTMFYPAGGAPVDRCLSVAADLNRNLGTARGSDYEYRCLVRGEPWRSVQ
jgi:hypothetical protein